MAASLADQTPGEQFLDYLRRARFVDQKSKEIQDIQKAVKTILNGYIQPINRIHDFIQIKTLKQCGSTKEGTRVWMFSGEVPVLEFDFLAILKRPPTIDKIAHEICTGFLAVAQKGVNISKIDFSKKGVFLLTKDVTGHFSEILVTTIHKQCDCNKMECNAGVYSITNTGKCCSRCSVHKKTGTLTIASSVDIGSPFHFDCNLILKWTRKAEASHRGQHEGKEVLILIDLLPAFGLHKLKKKIESAGLRNLVPKPCGKHDSCWKVSNCNEEMKALKKTSQMHRDLYMALKCIIDYVFPKSQFPFEYIPSYIVKTALLRHINNCCKHSQADMEYCLYDILSYLSESYEHRRVESFYTGINLLSSKQHYGDSYFHLRSWSFSLIKRALCNFEHHAKTIRNSKDLIELFQSVFETYTHLSFSLSEGTVLTGACSSFERHPSSSKRSDAKPQHAGASTSGVNTGAVGDKRRTKIRSGFKRSKALNPRLGVLFPQDAAVSTGGERRRRRSIRSDSKPQDDASGHSSSTDSLYSLGGKGFNLDTCALFPKGKIQDYDNVSVNSGFSRVSFNKSYGRRSREEQDYEDMYDGIDSVSVTSESVSVNSGFSRVSFNKSFGRRFREVQDYEDMYDGIDNVSVTSESVSVNSGFSRVSFNKSYGRIAREVQDYEDMHDGIDSVSVNSGNGSVNSGGSRRSSRSWRGHIRRK